jgi:hypothetical protein
VVAAQLPKVRSAPLSPPLSSRAPCRFRPSSGPVSAPPAAQLAISAQFSPPPPPPHAATDRRAPPVIPTVAPHLSRMGLESGCNAPHPRARAFPWARTPMRDPSAFIRRRHLHPWGFPQTLADSICAAPSRNPRARPPPPFSRSATVPSSWRSSGVAQAGEEDRGAFGTQARAPHCPRALTGARRREPSAPPSHAPSPSRPRRPRHPRRVRRDLCFTLVQAARQIVLVA